MNQKSQKDLNLGVQRPQVETPFSSSELMALSNVLLKGTIVDFSDKNGNIINVNENFLKITGYDREEIIGKNYRILNSSVHEREFFKGLWSTLKSHDIWQGEICIRTKYGEFKWLKTTISPIVNTEGNIYQFVSVREDITELKHNQIENWKQTQLQTAINKSTNNFIIRMDLDGTITYVNKAFEDMFECKKNDLIYKETILSFLDQKEIIEKTKEINLHYGADIVSGLDTLVFKTRKGEENNVDWTINTKSGKKYYVQLCVNYILDQEKNPEAFVVVGVDFTQRKLHEKALIKNRNEALADLKFKNEYTSRLSHELKTPINGIMGMVDLLENTNINSEQKDYLETIQKSTDRLVALVNKTLEFDKVERGDIEVIHRKFSLKEMLSQIEKQFCPLLEAKKIQFKVVNKVQDDYCVGNEKRIYQIVNYFLENSLRATNKGQISLTLSKTLENELHIEVRDTGIGISPERKDHIFKPFIFEHSTSQDLYNGFGLSLAISKKIIQSLGGEIGFKSSSGLGTLFWIKVPVNQVCDLKSISKFDKERDFSNFTQLNVLVVEDDNINQRLMKKMLNKLQIYPEVVSNGLEALEIQSIQKFNIIFMDVNLPIMDGIEVTQKIRERADIYGDPYIIAVTASSSVEDQERCMQAGMNNFLAKPVNRLNIESVFKNNLLKENEKKSVDSKNKMKFYFSKLMDDYKEDTEILEEFIQAVYTKVPNRLEVLEMAIKENRYADIEIESHNLKELMASFYHEELRRGLENIEKYGSDKMQKNIHPLFVDLRFEIFNFIEELYDFFALKKVG